MEISNIIGGVMVSVPSSSVKPKTIILVFFSSPLHYEERAKTGWLGIRVMCPSGTTCLSAECCFRELAL